MSRSVLVAAGTPAAVIRGRDVSALDRVALDRGLPGCRVVARWAR